MRERRYGALSGFLMTEIDLLERSSFEWVDLFGTEDALLATGFSAWGGVFWLDGLWYGIGGARGDAAAAAGHRRAQRLPRAGRRLAERPRDRRERLQDARLADQPATQKQLQYLSPAARSDYGLTRYKASALMTFGFNKRAIRQLILSAAPTAREAA